MTNTSQPTPLERAGKEEGRLFFFLPPLSIELKAFSASFPSPSSSSSPGELDSVSPLFPPSPCVFLLLFPPAAHSLPSLRLPRLSRGGQWNSVGRRGREESWQRRIFRKGVSIQLPSPPSFFSVWGIQMMQCVWKAEKERGRVSLRTLFPPPSQHMWM